MEYSEANQDELKQIHLEFDATLSEVRWRLVELSRRVTLQSLTLGPVEVEIFKPLIEALGAKT
jgi:hypothetical protein